MHSINRRKRKRIRLNSNMGIHAYSHHAQMGITFLSNSITPIKEYYDTVKRYNVLHIFEKSL